MAERSKALVLGTSLRAWVRIPLVSAFIPPLQFGGPRASCQPTRGTGATNPPSSHVHEVCRNAYLESAGIDGIVVNAERSS